MSEKRRKSWRLRVIPILICLGVGWLLYAGVMNWIAWHFAREISQGRQNLNIVPSGLKETTIEELPGPGIEKFGMSFHVPWKEIEHDRTTNSVAIVGFKEGAVLTILNPATAAGDAKTMRGSTAQQLRIMTSVFGSQALSSNYELMAAEMQATPADVRWWAGRSSNVRSGILLGLKSSILRDTTVVHDIHSNVLRGFQFGDPTVSPYRVYLNLFDEADRHYEIWIIGKDKSGPCVTQVQINGLVASFRGLPPGPASSASSKGD